jgi:hypothetical protein
MFYAYQFDLKFKKLELIKKWKNWTIWQIVIQYKNPLKKELTP